MLNIDDFIKRVEILLDHYSISASVFADKLGVQRSSLSHLLSGRNKPSLDFIMKISESFPDADLYWLLYGEGSFPKKEGAEANNIRVNQDATPVATQLNNNNATSLLNLFPAEEIIPKQNTEEEKSKEEKQEHTALPLTGDIERIVVFYKNGTFKNYNPG